MEINKSEYVSNITINADDIVIDYLFTILEKDGIVCEKAYGPVAQIGDRTFELRTYKFDLDNIDVFDMMFPRKVSMNSFEVTDYTNKIVSECLVKLNDEIEKRELSLFIFYGIEIGIDFTNKCVQCRVRFYGE